MQRMKKGIYSLLNAYLILLFVCLPLYLRNGLTMIGDAKYLFFRNTTMVLGAFLLIALLPLGVCKVKEGTGAWKSCKLSAVDWMVLSFGIVTIFSYLCCIVKDTAFWGFPGWYMGMVSQIFFVGIYYFCSRWYDGSKSIWGMAGAAAGAVMLVGVLNRLDIDVLHVFDGLGVGDWNRTHLISTIGNNNWYAGYISVTAGILLTAMCVGKGWIRVLGTMGSFVYFATALTQGSMTGICAAVVLVLVVCLVSLNCRQRLIRAMEAALLLPLSNIMLRVYMHLGITGLVMESDGVSRLFFHWSWYVLLAGILVIYLVLRLKEKEGKKDGLADGRLQRQILIVCGIVLTAAGIVIAVCMLWDDLRMHVEELLHMEHYGRLALWSAALEAFFQEDFLQKLLGAGPDCFYHVLYEWTSLGQKITMEGIWEDAVYCNAHNEWLTMLINQGILGMLSYGGIFVAALCSLRNKLWEKPELLMIFLGIAGYLVCSLFTFQHVLSTPFLFALIGMAEALKRA